MPFWEDLLGGIAQVGGDAISAFVPGAIGSSLGQTVNNWGTTLMNRSAEANAAAYNTPQAQMGRFAAAGLNPNLIYGQSNVVSAPAPISNQSPLLTGQDYAAKKAQTNNIIAQSTSSAHNDFLTDAKVINTDADTDLKRSDLNLHQQLDPLTVGKASSDILKTKADIQLEGAQLASTISATARANALQAPNLAIAWQTLANDKLKQQDDPLAQKKIQAQIDLMTSSKLYDDAKKINISNTDTQTYLGMLARMFKFVKVLK